LGTPTCIVLGNRGAMLRTAIRNTLITFAIKLSTIVVLLLNLSVLLFNLNIGLTLELVMSITKATGLMKMFRNIQNIPYSVLVVHSCQQKSIGLKFSKSQTGSNVRYSCHHNSSLLLSPYLRIRAVSLSSIHYNQSHRVYINRRRQYICLI